MHTVQRVGYNGWLPQLTAHPHWLHVPSPPWPCFVCTVDCIAPLLASNTSISVHLCWKECTWACTVMVWRKA